MHKWEWAVCSSMYSILRMYWLSLMKSSTAGDIGELLCNSSFLHFLSTKTLNILYLCLSSTISLFPSISLMQPIADFVWPNDRLELHFWLVDWICHELDSPIGWSSNWMLFSPRRPIDQLDFRSVICFHVVNFHETTSLITFYENSQGGLTVYSARRKKCNRILK